jgi:co-chaperonin GroES (HSP10)
MAEAVGPYLVIEKIKEGPQMIGGLEIPDEKNTELRFLKAKVISVGGLAQTHSDGAVKPGDVIHYDRHAAHGINVKDKSYHVIKLIDVAAID